jgi:hypothetical protein
LHLPNTETVTPFLEYVALLAFENKDATTSSTLIFFPAWSKSTNNIKEEREENARVWRMRLSGPKCIGAN